MTEQYHITKAGHEALAKQGITTEALEEARKTMNENSFEQELIRAIEHGCPKCGRHNLMAMCTQAHYYDLYSLGNNGVDYEEDDDLAGPLDTMGVWCYDCGPCSFVWTAEDGWVLEMQEVVKGE